jgi:hypothetical protein
MISSKNTKLRIVVFKETTLLLYDLVQQNGRHFGRGRGGVTKKRLTQHTTSWRAGKSGCLYPTEINVYRAPLHFQCSNPQKGVRLDPSVLRACDLHIDAEFYRELEFVTAVHQPVP